MTGEILEAEMVRAKSVLRLARFRLHQDAVVHGSPWRPWRQNSIAGLDRDLLRRHRDALMAVRHLESVAAHALLAA
jgi:hypothetical protein